MGERPTAWHVLLAILLGQRGPGSIEIRSEVRLSAEPLRLDYLLIRRTGPGLDDDAQTLRRLWPLLPRETVVEFKSVGRPYRSRNLDRLWGYLHIHYAGAAATLATRADLAGVLLVPQRTRPLDADVVGLGLAFHDLGGGYYRLGGGPLPMFVAELDVVGDAEEDDLLRLFGHHAGRSVAARQWLAQQLGAKEIDMAMNELEDYDEVIRILLDKMPPEQRLAGMPPEQRLAGMAPEERLLTLADDTLRAFPDDYLRSLPPHVREAIRLRIGRPS